MAMDDQKFAGPARGTNYSTTKVERKLRGETVDKVPVPEPTGAQPTEPNKLRSGKDLGNTSYPGNEHRPLGDMTPRTDKEIAQALKPAKLPAEPKKDLHPADTLPPVYGISPKDKPKKEGGKVSTTNAPIPKPVII